MQPPAIENALKRVTHITRPGMGPNAVRHSSATAVPAGCLGQGSEEVRQMLDITRTEPVLGAGYRLLYPPVRCPAGLGPGSALVALHPVGGNNALDDLSIGQPGLKVKPRSERWCRVRGLRAGAGA